MQLQSLNEPRKSFMEYGRIYFWTSTIHKWQRLLFKDDYKAIILNSLHYLHTHNKIDVFGFVIMPNHIHLIWRMKELNGKETPQGSFLKYTAHEFGKLILADADNSLVSYAVNAANKKHEFWQRDPLAIELYTRKVAFQKLDYLHFNPCTEYWQLAASPGEYYFSSANFYETGKIDFPFLSDLRDEF